MLEVAAALHHTSRQRTSTTAAATQTMNCAPDPAAATYSATTMTTSGLIEYVEPVPVIADFLGPPVPVIEHVMPTPVVNYTALFETTPAPTDIPVIEHIEPAPVFEFLAPTLHLVSSFKPTPCPLSTTGSVHSPSPITVVEASASPFHPVCCCRLVSVSIVIEPTLRPQIQKYM